MFVHLRNKNQHNNNHHRQLILLIKRPAPTIHEREIPKNKPFLLLPIHHPPLHLPHLPDLSPVRIESNRMYRTRNNRNQKQESKIHSTSNTRNAAASYSDGLASLSNDDLENARERVARMLMEAEILIEDETKNERERSVNKKNYQSHETMNEKKHLIDSYCSFIKTTFVNTCFHGN